MVEAHCREEMRNGGECGTAHVDGTQEVGSQQPSLPVHCLGVRLEARAKPEAGLILREAEEVVHGLSPLPSTVQGVPQGCSCTFR